MDRLVVWHRIHPTTRDDGDTSAAVDAWAGEVRQRLSSVNAEVVARVGGTIVATADLTDIYDVLEITLALARDARERAHLPAMSLGVACGAFIAGDPGGVADRAQFLSNRARAGEIVLDLTSHDLVADVFLFRRRVGSIGKGTRGWSIDGSMPLRSECRRAIAHLAPPPVPPITREALAPLEKAVQGPRQSRRALLLRGPSGSGVDSLLDELGAAGDHWCLRISGVPGALEPLGSLRLALLRDRDHAGGSLLECGDAADVGILEQVAAGEPVSVDAVTRALEHLFTAAPCDLRPWVVLDPLPTVDPTSLEVLLEATERAPAVVIARAAVDAQVPAAAKDVRWEEIVLPALRLEDAKEVARRVLGAADDDVVRHVAVTGGDSVLGVVEAARTLVAAGDLIRDGERFEWRVGARPGKLRPVPVEDLVRERLRGLEEEPLRMLEAASICPPGTPRVLIAAVAGQDGLDAESREDAVQTLQREAFVVGPQLQPTSEHLRRLVFRTMPPARLAELERFLADAMRRSKLGEGLALATVGYFLADGGDVEAGVRALLQAAHAALGQGHGQAVRRLAATALQFGAQGDLRDLAIALARNAAALVSERSASRPPPPRPAEAAVHAITAGDLDAIEALVENAIAEGRDVAAGERVRMLAHLAKGNLADAQQHQANLRRLPPRDSRRARDLLAQSWVALAQDDVESALRLALRGLARARAGHDAKGERVALQTLAACYRMVGRDEAGDRLGGPRVLEPADDFPTAVGDIPAPTEGS